MKIPHKKRRDYWHLVSAILWSIYGAFGFIDNSHNWIHFLALFCSLAFFLLFLFDEKTYYLKLNNGIIIQNGLFDKKTNLNEIKEIKRQSKYIILKTNKKILKINTDLIAANLLSELIIELEKLNIKNGKAFANSNKF